MTKPSHLVAALVVFSLVFVFGVPGTAQMAQAQGFGATVIKDITGTVVGRDWGGPFALRTNRVHTVVTKSGKTKVTCIFDIPPGYEPAKAEIRRGFVCGTLLGPSTDSISITTPGGKVILICHINGKG